MSPGHEVQAFLLLAAVMFSVGVYGLLSRRNSIGILLSVELMANAVNVNLVAFARLHSSTGGGATGQVFALFAIALTVAEVAVGLALVLLIGRQRRSIAIDEVRTLRG